MTHAGTVFKRHVDALPHQLDDGMAAASQLIEPETGTVALAFQQSLGAWLVPDLVRTCRAAHPGARFQLTQVRDELQSAALDGGQADLEIGTPPYLLGCARASRVRAREGRRCRHGSSPPAAGMAWGVLPPAPLVRRPLMGTCGLIADS